MKETSIFLKETGISFHKDMIAAIDEGNKTMTRRIITPQPSPDWMKNTKQFSPSGKMYDGSGKRLFWLNDPTTVGKEIRCRYGKPRDLLYIKESWFVAAITGNRVLIGYDKNNPDDTHEIVTDNIDYYWERMNKARVFSPMFMPKEVARKWLLVKEIRVERLQNIDISDALAEGIEGEFDTYRDYSEKCILGSFVFDNPIDSFRTLWEKISENGGWEANPFVFVIRFSKIQNPYPNN